MNVHHLELFYYVAKHHGISAAARHIPYGIQQPAISAQVINLEDSLGVTLFHRRPFSLTQAGRELFAFIEPFFGKLSDIDARLRGGRVVRLRIGAPEPIQHNYLPAMLQTLKKRVPELSFSLTSGLQDVFEQQLLAQEIDIAFTGIHGKPAPGIQCQEMIRIPLALVVRERSGFKKAQQLWEMDRIDEPLLCVPVPEPVTTIFLTELQRRKIEWYPSLELASLDLVGRYVAEGFGIGLTIMQPDVPAPAGTRLIPLTDFPEVPYAALWLGKINPLLETVLREARSIAGKVSSLSPA
ncbi:LysR family transcriptional regulator [Phragmitibacter flavus]|uniref:LysR family transcriptional regulator n=1 Tax=Phragmitibacter flavus TaxID=2576071 RepID=A0A5R8KK87_9BACT|nr:LysR family transcriptional regulator [Phragmitibacter flavus]TLD72734.1 LysR family transcriptional regulator [Phragmitibacter flavus]